MNETPLTQIKDTTANPAPLGLLGFGMTTVMLNLHNAGYFELNTMILAMGLCYGVSAITVSPPSQRSTPVSPGWPPERA